MVVTGARTGPSAGRGRVGRTAQRPGAPLWAVWPRDRERRSVASVSDGDPRMAGLALRAPAQEAHCGAHVVDPAPVVARRALRIGNGLCMIAVDHDCLLVVFGVVESRRYAR